MPKSTCLGEDQSGSTHSGLPHLKSMRKDLFGDIHFFQTDLGVIVGSVGLLILWLQASNNRCCWGWGHRSTWVGSPS